MYSVLTNKKLILIAEATILIIILYTTISLVYYLISFPKISSSPDTNKKGNVLILHNFIFNNKPKVIKEITEDLNKNGWDVTYSLLNYNVNPDSYSADVLIFYLPSKNIIFDNLIKSRINSFSNSKNYKKVVFILRSNTKDTYIKDFLSKKFFNYTEIFYDNQKVSNTIDNYLKTTDIHKLEDFVLLSKKINSLYQETGNLPINIEYLNYDDMDYKRISNRFYKICATFNYNISQNDFNNANHTKGYNCYLFSVNSTAFANSQIQIKDQLLYSELELISNKLKFLNELPNTLDKLEYTDNLYFDSSYYKYNKDSNNSYTLCGEFFNPVYLGIDTFVEKNYVCTKLNKGESINSTKFNGLSYLLNNNFEDWVAYKEFKIPKGWYVNDLSNTGDSITVKDKLNTNKFLKDFSVELNTVDSIFLESTPLKVKSGLYTIQTSYTTTSTCENCAIIGVKFYNTDNKNISKLYKNCGIYNTYFDFIYLFIKPNNENIEQRAVFSCNINNSTSNIQVLFGLLNSTKDIWSFDNFYVSSTLNYVY